MVDLNRQLLTNMQHILGSPQSASRTGQSRRRSCLRRHAQGVRLDAPFPGVAARIVELTYFIYLYTRLRGLSFFLPSTGFCCIVLH